MQRRTFVQAAVATLGAPRLAWAASSFVRIGGGTPGGAYYVCAGAVSRLLEAVGMSPRVQTTGGGRQNAILLHRAELDIGFVNNIDAVQSANVEGRGDIRSIIPFFNSIHHFVVRADKPIHSLTDLDGQRFGLSNRGSTHDAAARQIFEILGVKPRYQNAGKGDTNNMIKDGLLTGFFATSGIPMPSILELQTTVDLRFLSFTDAEYAEIRNQAPWLIEDLITPELYDGLDTPLKSFSSLSVLMANKDVPDELVYDIADICYSSTDAIRRTYRAAEVNPDHLERLILPLHPGAEAYYREKGIEIPERLAS
ncbi:MAG: TAXI family TRAP transporter solute-binding subunit [Gammaproteobacteria bacterium]|nr:TAXI family TRAP transporter solute-binding subunit [Gammaproteobacteria bacterium]MDH3507038.1 TAXI family TRAP transporter solute-binding subunit [Gammaproteobacteria bacterium]